MSKIITFYFIIQLCIILFVIGAFIIWDKRYRKNHGSDVPKGFERTEEVNIDPSNGKRFRVYYNKITGERFYHEEKSI